MTADDQKRPPSPLEQLEMLRVTLSSIGDGVIVTDVQGRIVFMNPVAVALTEWPLEAARHRPLADVFRIVNEYSRETVANPVAKVLDTGAAAGLANHTILLSRGGRELPIDDSAAPIRMPDGTLAGVVLVFRDITERRQADHTRGWLAAIVDSSGDAIVSKTLDGRITSWNTGAMRLLGYTPEEAIGQPITMIIPPELQHEEQEILARLRVGARVEHYDTVRIRKDGKRVEVSLSVSPIRDIHGRIVGASKIARDITERKRTEQALREADRRKDEFLATLAQELRNPLAPIRNAAELLGRSESLRPEVRSACEIIKRQVGQMTHLVDDLLDVSRIAAGRVRLQRESVDLKDAMAMAVESCRPAIESARHELQLSVPAEPLNVSGDRIRLLQVFSNVLNNATKYTPPEGLICVRMWREGAQAVISIRDNGIGIPPSKLDQVFDLFAQLDHSYDRTGGGLGIGLTLARRLVEMHGGRIEARSEGADRGSEFIIRLPTVDVASPEVGAERQNLSRRAGRRVLIADDNQDAAVSLGMLVQVMGHETRIVHDGQAAVTAAEEFRPDIALLDIGMPVMDGYEAARRIADQPWAASMLLVALTGWGQESDRRRALEAGFHRHLVKPVDPDVLSGLLTRARPD